MPSYMTYNVIQLKSSAKISNLNVYQAFKYRKQYVIVIIHKNNIQLDTNCS